MGRTAMARKTAKEEMTLERLMGMTRKEVLKMEIMDVESNKVPMKDMMSFETFKMQVYICIVNYNNHTIKGAKSLMKEYEDDLQDFWEDMLAPIPTAAGMCMHLL